jgi:uncharacterized NAD-dependent epimerase/dehydratase family protein
MVLCHHAGRERIRAPLGEATIPPLADLVREYQQAAAWVRPARVVAVALNTLGLEAAAAREAVAAAARETGLPASDPVRFGAGPLAEAVIAARAAGRDHATAP